MDKSMLFCFQQHLHPEDHNFWTQQPWEWSWHNRQLCCSASCFCSAGCPEVYNFDFNKQQHQQSIISYQLIIHKFNKSSSVQYFIVNKMYNLYHCKLVESLKELDAQIDVLCGDVGVNEVDELSSLCDDVERFQVVRLFSQIIL